MRTQKSHSEIMNIPEPAEKQDLPTVDTESNRIYWLAIIIGILNILLLSLFTALFNHP